jgi:hypothetical protein
MCVPAQRLIAVFVPLVSFTLPACDRLEPDSLDGAGASDCRLTGEPLSLTDTFYQLRACFEERSLLAMQPYIDPAGQDEVIELLLAMDELVAANNAMLQTIKRAAPDMELEEFDMSWLADKLDLFSRDVEFVSCEERGDRGVVILNVSDRPPLEEIEFVRRDDYWLYVPGPAEPEVTEIIREIARAMGRVVFSIPSRELSPQEIRDEYRLLVMTKLRDLTDLPSAAAARGN